jgi:hypothetical protein
LALALPDEQHAQVNLVFGLAGALLAVIVAAIRRRR